MSLSKLWLLSTVGTMEQMDKSRDPEVQHALRERIRREANKRRAGYIRPPTDMHSTSHCSVRRLLGSEYERHLTEAVQRRTAVAGRWFRIATEADLARDFAAALCNLKSESLSRFTSSVLTETPLPPGHLFVGGEYRHMRAINVPSVTPRHKLRGIFYLVVGSHSNKGGIPYGITWYYRH